MKSEKIREAKQFSLPNYSNNFEAEAIAITKAIEYITFQQNEGSYQVLTDSLSVLLGVNNPENLNPYICRIKVLLKQATLKSEITLTYVKGHSGNIGNDIADESAKKAIGYGEEINLPISKKLKKNYKKEYIKSGTNCGNKIKCHRKVTSIVGSKTFIRSQVNLLQIIKCHKF